MACLALVVEDDDDIRDSLVDELIELGCETAVANSGREALDQLQAGLRPDFILLDLLLPVMTGPELLRALKLDVVLSTIPVVLMSASRVSAVLSDTSGTQQVLKKPLRRWQLEQIVDWFGGTRSGSKKLERA